MECPYVAYFADDSRRQYRPYAGNGLKNQQGVRVRSVDAFFNRLLYQFDFFLIGMDAVERAGQRDIQRFVHTLIEPIGIPCSLPYERGCLGKVGNAILAFLGEECQEFFL